MASNISFPTVIITSLDGIQPNICSTSQSGVAIFSSNFSGVGLSTFILLPSSVFTNLSKSSFALSIESCVRLPCFPFITESGGILQSTAGSGAGMQQLSALPTITCFNGSHSFQL